MAEFLCDPDFLGGLLISWCRSEEEVFLGKDGTHQMYKSSSPALENALRVLESKSRLALTKG